MDTQTITTLLAMAGFAVALFTYLATMKRDLRSEMSVHFAAERARNDGRFESVDARFDSIDSRFDHLDSRIGELRDDMRSGFAEVRQRLSVLEQRTYDLGSRRDVS